MEVVSVPLTGEHYRRRPFQHLGQRGLDVVQRDRFKLGMVERLRAVKPVCARFASARSGWFPTDRIPLAGTARPAHTRAGRAGATSKGAGS
jgi:hypothetical protein